MKHAESPARTVRFGGRQTPGGYLFEVTGGRLCLDLANTKDERRTDHPRELLARYQDAVDWAVQAGAVAAAAGEQLRRQAAQHPRVAAAALARLIRAREVLFEVFSAATAGREAGTAALAAFNALIAEVRGRQRLEQMRGGGFEWRWREGDELTLDRPLWDSAISAADLLTSPDLVRVRQCDGEGCAWLFVDTSKNASRRWCDMSVCGNRAKARRHRQKASRT